MLFVCVFVVLVMEEFNVVEFCSNPSVEDLGSERITKDNWKFIATYFRVSYKSHFTKSQIKNLVLDTLVEQAHLPKTALDFKSVCDGLDQECPDVPDDLSQRSCTTDNSLKAREIALEYRNVRLLGIHHSKG